MLALLALQVISALDCTFETAFEKGQADIETGSFGANVDRFCLYSPDEARMNFAKYYELGRQHGPTLKKAEIRTIPKSQTELDALLRDASLAMTTKEIVDRMSKIPAPSTPNNQEIQNLTRRLDALEVENKELKEKLGQSGSK